MAPGAENENIRVACRKFLNTGRGLRLDPANLTDSLVEAGIIESEDAELVQSQPSLPHRQYVLLLQLLPSKDADTILRAAAVFHNCDQPEAVELGDVIISALDHAVSKRKFVFFQAVEGEAEEEEFQKLQVSELAVAPDLSGTESDQVATPEELHAPELPADEDQLNAADVQVGKVIGSGAFAVVHVGTYAGEQVAIKKFFRCDNFGLSMFKAEIDIMKKLNHPNVVKFVGYTTHANDDCRLWLLTEFVSGGSMRRFCQPNPPSPLSLANKVKLAIECWKGLAYMHSLNCCHRDISPNNILVSTDLTQVKIADFGLSEFKALMVTNATAAREGTAMYHPPEFACASGPLRHPVKSDVYSMGASLCELFSEQYFWHRDGQPLISVQVCWKLVAQRQQLDSNQPPDEPSCWSDVPDIVKAVLKDAINPDYRKRKTASELREMTEALLREL